MKNNRYSTSYYATVDMVDGKVAPHDQAVLDGIKMVVYLHNAAHEKHTADQKRVKLQGRGPRAHDGKKYNMTLPLKYAQRADIYVYERR